jgi:FdhD protein
LLTTERILAIYLQYELEENPRQLSITMRTPGNDKALAIGFIFNEGIIKTYDQVEEVNFITDDEILLVIKGLRPIDDIETDRSFMSSASCGMCGKSSIEDALKVNFSSIETGDLTIDANVVKTMGEKLRSAQNNFDQTGGIHAVGLFNSHGKLLEISEDIGRHNALDKMIGEQLMTEALPMNDKILLLSGRIGYELVQKSLMAAVPILIAIGAPSSLSYDISKEYNQTLIGFLKKESFNIYTGDQRVTNLQSNST